MLNWRIGGSTTIVEAWIRIWRRITLHQCRLTEEKKNMNLHEKFQKINYILFSLWSNSCKSKVWAWLLSPAEINLKSKSAIKNLNVGNHSITIKWLNSSLLNFRTESYFLSHLDGRNPFLSTNEIKVKFI